jgi:hypothetical protein
MTVYRTSNISVMLGIRSRCERTHCATFWALMLRWVFVHTSHLSLNACGALAFGVTNDELTDVCSTRAAEVVGLAVEVLNEEFWKFNGD